MEQEFVEVIASSRALADRLKAEYSSRPDYEENPPETHHEPAQPHHDTGGKRQGNTQASKQVGEDGYHKLEQGADNQARQADDCDGIDQRRFDGSFQANRFLDVDRQALQDDVQNTAGFAGFNHVGGEIVEDD